MPSSTPKRGFIKPSAGDLVTAFQPNISTALDVIDNMIDDADARLTNVRVPTDGSVTTAKIAAGGIAQSAVTNLVAELATKPTKAILADSIRYVSVSGSDLNDGLNPGTPKRNISAAISSLSGIGLIKVAKGTFSEALDIPTGVVVEGSGRGVTILTIPNSTNRAVVRTSNFAALTGTNGTGGASQWALRNLTVDGNKTNQSSGTCWGVQSYGLDFILSDVTVKSCRTGGIFSEWSTAATASGDSMDSWLVNVKVHDNDGIGIDWNGPHHSKWLNVSSYLNTDRGFRLTGAGSSVQAANCHSWGITQLYAWDIAAGGCQLSNCSGEAAIAANALIQASSTSISGGLWQGTGLTTTLTSGINNSQTSIGVALGGLTTAPYEAVIDSEIIRVTAGEGTTTWTIQRAQRGTTAVAHSSGARVYLGTPYNFQIGTGSSVLNTKIDATTSNGRAAVNFVSDVGSEINIVNYQPLGYDSVGNPVASGEITTYGGAVRTLRNDVVVNVRRFGARGDGVTDDRAALELAALALIAAGGGWLYFPPGTYLVGVASNPDVPDYWAGLHLPDGCGIRGAGKLVSKILLAPRTISFNPELNRSVNVVMSRNLSAGSSDLALEDITVDGNAINQVRTIADGVTSDTDATVTSATAAFVAADVGSYVVGAGIPADTYIASINSSTSVELSAAATATASGVSLSIGSIHNGVLWRKFTRVRHNRCRVMNARGYSSSPPGETFQISVESGFDVSWVDSEVTCTSGVTGSGYGLNAVTKATWWNSPAWAMTHGNGYAINACKDLTLFGSNGYLCGAQGINVELSDDVKIFGGTGGGAGHVSVGNPPFPHASGDDLGNTGHGIALNVVTRYQVLGATATHNTLSGITVVGASSGSIIGGNFSDNANWGIWHDTTAILNASVSGNPITENNPNGNVMPASGDLVPENIQVGNYVLTRPDLNKCITMAVGSANTVTIPPNSTVPFPVGTMIEVYQYDTGQTEIVLGAGVSLLSHNGWKKVAFQHGSIRLRKRDTNQWVATGDLAA